MDENKQQFAIDGETTDARKGPPNPSAPPPSYYIRAESASSYSRDGGGADGLGGPLRASVPFPAPAAPLKFEMTHVSG
ncbi:MAG: hypothetical protein ACYDER_20305 [Ktedonobacteraceae bacterium]